MTSPTFYQIKIKGQLDLHWAEWFNGLTISHKADGTTVLSEPVVDQAALYGILLKLHNLNLALLSVNPMEAETET